MLKEFTKFYYHALEKSQKNIYVELYEGFKERREKIEIHTNPATVSYKDVYDIAVSVYNDTPSFYYLDMSFYTWKQTSFGYIYSPKYAYSEDLIKAFDAKLEFGLQKFFSTYITSDLTEYQKEKIIHDYLVKTVVYDNDAITCPKKNHDAYNVLGPLLKQKGVCWGIACAFKLLCDYCKIKSFVVIGDILPKSRETKHAWNIVKLNGESYHVDPTWDIKKKGDISFCYDYFNLNDRLIRVDHTWESKLYPKCDSIQKNYYYKNKLYVKELVQLSSYISERLLGGETYIAVKYVSDMPSDDDIYQAIKNGFQLAKKYVGYKMFVSRKTHNIYIEIV